MKIRNGFVSNSSSSSFLVCGISDTDSINSVLMKNNIMNSEITDTAAFFLFIKITLIQYKIKSTYKKERTKCSLPESLYIIISRIIYHKLEFISSVNMP